jgi:hypothetical protein
VFLAAEGSAVLAVAADGARLAPRPYRFDPGGAGSTLEPGAIRLAPPSSYTRERGYGWTDGLLQPYSRPELKQSRSPWTIDGVVAREIGFRADLPPGAWWLTLWVEAGQEDASTLSGVIGAEPWRPAWQSFLPPAEPRPQLQKTFRLLHARVEVEEAGLSFRLVGGQDLVRLLAFSLWPDPVPHSERDRKVLAALGDAGRYGAHDDPEALRARLAARFARDPADAFAGYWSEQLGLLALAEEYVRMGGWRWASARTGLGIFDRFHQAVMILDGLLDRPDREGHPHFERALWQRGRVLYWLARERHGRDEEAGARRDLASLLARHPDDPLLAMYNGRRIHQPDRCDALPASPEAPAWSVAQREALCRLGEVAHYWVERRQAADGEFGGKLDDDVELLRWWPPLLLAGDPVALKGWKRLADGVWRSEWIEDGYDKRVLDVEHGSELIADTAPGLAVFTDEPECLDRLRPSARHFEQLWTALTASGRRFFRSAWFSSREVDVRPPRDRDVEMNTRAVKAARYLAWKTREPTLIRTLHEWARAWVDAALRTDKGKPLGLIPASVRFTDEAINGDEPTWHRANMFWDYYDWRGGAMMLDHQLFVYTLTGDGELLRPLLAALDLVRRYEASHADADGAAPPAAGSPEWAAAVLARSDAFWSVVEQWRLLTGDTRYDDLLARRGTPYLRYRLTGREEHLMEGLASMLETVRYNAPLRTSEALHTDRVYVAPEKTVGADHIKAMLTGDGTLHSPSPYYAVTWEDTDPSFTCLVSDARVDRLAVRVFSHALTERRVRMRNWQLAPGSYLLELRARGAQTREQIELGMPGERVMLRLPPRTLLEVALERARPG